MRSFPKHSNIFVFVFEIALMAISSDILSVRIFGGSVLCCDVYIYEKTLSVAHVYGGVF